MKMNSLIHPSSFIPHPSIAVLGEQTSSLGEVAGEIDFDAAVIGAEMERQFPLAVDRAEHVGEITLNTVLPDVFLQGREQLRATLGAKADSTSKLAEDGTGQERLRHGPQLA